MTDIRIKTNFLRNPKILKLKKRLGAEGVLQLQALWCHCGEEVHDGDISRLDHEDVENITGCDDGPEFIAALVDLRLVDREGDNFRLHDWEENNPWAFSTPQRKEIARKAAKIRWAVADSAPMRRACAEHAPSMRHAYTPHAEGNAENTNEQCPLPIPSQPFPFPSPKPNPSMQDACGSHAPSISPDLDNLADLVSGLFSQLHGLREGFDPGAFLAQNQNQRFHPKAYLDTGQWLLDHLTEKTGSNGNAKFVIENPYTYGRVLLKKFSANHCEAENIAKSESHKKGLSGLKQAIGAIG